MKKDKQYAKPFEQWLREEVEITFGIKKVYQLPNLEKLVNTTLVLAHEVLQIAQKIHRSLFDYIDIYNEDELKMFVISTILNEIDFRTPVYRAFTQRTIEFTTQTAQNTEISVKGVVELVVAVGKQTPQKPFFFLQEFKQSLKRNNDPLGQLLIAMMAAQVNNNEPEKPIYGCYVLGEHWHFVVLEGKQYAVTLSYDVKKLENLEQIIRILKQQKQYIETELGLQT